jgi:hypothetical protein
VIFTADDTLLFSRIVTPDAPLDFEQHFARLAKDKKPIKLNGDLRPRLKIALAMAARVCGEMRTNVKVHKNLMEFASLSDRGQQFDQIELKHPNVETTFNAEKLTKVYDRYEALSLSPDVAMMSRDNEKGIFLLACYT